DGDLDCYVLNHPIAWSKVNSIRGRQEGGKFIRETAPTDEWESDKLYRNDTPLEGGGRVKFTNVSQQAGINNRAWGLSATVSDFNEDGYPDLLVGNDYIEPDYLYINTPLQGGKGGERTFSIQTDRYFRHTSNHTMGVDIADFNNDGLIDLAALDMIAEDNRRQKELMTTMLHDRYKALVQFGYGHQIMRNALQVNTGATPLEGGRGVADGGATFSEIGNLAGVSNTDWSWSPLFADLDNDGLKDLFVTNGYRRDVTNLDYLMYTVDSAADASGQLDFNRFKTFDDYLKLIPSVPLQKYAFKNVDGLNFQNASTAWGLVQKGFSNGSAFADLDADGDLDLVVNNIDSEAFIWKNKSADAAGQRSASGGGGSPSGAGGASNWLQIKLKGSPKNPFAVGAKARISYADGKSQYLELTGNRGFFSTSELLLHFGLGDAAQVDELVVQFPDGKVLRQQNVKSNQRLSLDWQQAAPGKFLPESKPAPPLFAPAKNAGIEFRHVEDDFGDFTREFLLPHKFSNLGSGIAVGDVNGDGREDFFIGGATGQLGAIFLQNANATFSKSPQPALDADAVSEDMSAVFFDADGDRDLDLYVVSGGNSFEANSPSYQDRLYLNDGKGGFSKASGSLPAENVAGSCVAAHDFDGDGDLDLAVGGLVTPGRYPTPPQSFLLKNDGGKFTDAAPQLAPEFSKIGMVSDLLWTDLDGDKKAELVVAGEWLPVTIFNLAKSQSQQIANSEGWWNCLAAADLDGDGDLDLAGGNLGLNSRLRASETAPLRLYANDFDGNGSLEPVVARPENGKYYPLPMLQLLLKQMPSLKKKFVRSNVYAQSTIEDVFSESQLDAAQKFEAKTFATQWFENQGGGKWVAHRLPTEAQFAPCNAILTKDFNSDGKMDLLLAGNSSSPEVETGRYDAGNGCLLLGDGKGGFAFQPNRETGFWAVREARDLAEVKLANGRTLILVANNNDVLEGFHVD
ncbi:MAG: VCBS repeat-containing protein, partial [Bacteroidota bacterium]